MSFPLIEISQCCKVINGSTPSRVKPEYWNGEIDWVTPKDLSKLDSKYFNEAPEKITELGYKSCSTTIVPVGSLLYTSRAPIGHLAITQREICTNQGFKTLVPNDNVDVEFLYYVLKKYTPNLQDLGNGATFKELSKATISSYKIPLPPQDQQKKIASTLDAADAFRQKTKALIKKYEELTQSLFLDMFGDIRINENKYLEEKLETACSYITDGAHRTPKLLDVGFPFMTVSNMKEYGYDFTNCKKISAEDYTDLVKNNCQPKVNDILFSKDGTVGKVLRIREHQDLVLLSSIAILRFKDLYNPIYVEYYLKTDFFLFQATSRKSGSAIRRIVLKDLKKTKIALPPLELQNQFAERVQAIEAQKAQAQASLAQAEDLFNSLLQRAFKGELS